MRDIIWQQQNTPVDSSYQNERKYKINERDRQYATDQPEKIHFNVSPADVNSVNSGFSTSKPISKINKSNQKESTGIGVYLNGNSDIAGGKWSVATDDNQNPQVCIVACYC